VTGRIYDKLVNKFGKEMVFRDIDSIPYGYDFRSHIVQTLQECKIALAVIGDKWLDSEDIEGKRRVDNPQDFVRVEIETALKLNIPLIPLLVRNTKMP